MLIEHTMTALRHLKLHGMAEAFERQRMTQSLQDMSFEDRFSMIVDAERLTRETRRLDRFIKQARFKIQAAPEDIDYRAARGLDKRQIQSLLNCDWIIQKHHLIVTGATGLGKTWLACALGNQAVRCGLPVLYWRLARLLEDIEVARADGSLPKLRAQLQKARLLILDDWGVAPLSMRNRQDLLEVVDELSGTGAILLTSQLPVAQWHDYIGEPTIADAILDRLVHSAHKIELRGESLRKTKAGVKSV
jgi:DNA replication protein DnaC